MPYIDRAEQERARWMILTEAVKHIQAKDHCDSVEALRQLKLAIADKTVSAKWGDTNDRKDRPPAGRAYWQKAQLLVIGEHLADDLRVDTDWDTDCTVGLAPDFDRNEYRPLLVLRAQVFEIWPRQAASIAETQNGPTASKKLRAAAPTAIREAARKLYADAHQNPPNILVAEKLIGSQLPNASRSKIRDILREPEFANQRLPAGNQRKR